MLHFASSLLLLSPLLVVTHLQLNHKCQQNHHPPHCQPFAKSKWDFLLLILMAFQAALDIAGWLFLVYFISSSYSSSLRPLSPLKISALLRYNWQITLKVIWLWKDSSNPPAPFYYRPVFSQLPISSHSSLHTLPGLSLPTVKVAAATLCDAFTSTPNFPGAVDSQACQVTRTHLHFDPHILSNFLCPKLNLDLFYRNLSSFYN